LSAPLLDVTRLRTSIGTPAGTVQAVDALAEWSPHWSSGKRVRIRVRREREWTVSHLRALESGATRRIK
jgi:hypothetical protein